MQSYFIILSTAPPHNKHQLVEGSPALSFNGQTFRIPTTSKTAGNLTSTLHDAHTLTQTTLQYRVLQLPRSKTVISRTAIDGVPFFFFGIYIHDPSDQITQLIKIRNSHATSFQQVR
jgi:hypothetical protein